MATTYSQQKAAESEIAARNNQNLSRIAQAKALIDTTVSDLASEASQYGPIVADIAAAVAAAPTDAALLNLNSSIGKLVADFGALQTRAGTIKDAIANL